MFSDKTSSKPNCMIPISMNMNWTCLQIKADENGWMTERRVGVDDAFAVLRRVRDHGLGQPAQDAAALPHQHHLLAGVLLPDGGLQLAAVPECHGEQRPALHQVGQPAQAAPALPHHQGPPADGAERRAIRQEVQEGRPGAGPDRPGDPAAAAGPVQLRRVVLRGGGGGGAVLQPAGARQEGDYQGRRRVETAQGLAEQGAVCKEFQEAPV
uniref:Uncharacterized protein n=1 Tax=Arundo donax TaxID=35708 RepID=A0A0A9DNK2_ARUDO